MPIELPVLVECAGAPPRVRLNVYGSVWLYLDRVKIGKTPIIAGNASLTHYVPLEISYHRRFREKRPMYQQFLFPSEAGIPEDVRLVLVSLELDGDYRASAFPALSGDEARAAGRFLNQRDALRFAATRSALRENLAREVGVKDADLMFTRSALGRPFLTNCPDSTIDFNVSHSGAFALIAWSHQRRVGVDIEQCTAALNGENLHDLVLGKADRAAFAELPDQERRDVFFDVWVAKEALLKVSGSGIGGGLHDFSVLVPGSDQPQVSGESRVARDLDGFEALWIRRVSGYAACVAWSE